METRIERDWVRTSVFAAPAVGLVLLAWYIFALEFLPLVGVFLLALTAAPLAWLAVTASSRARCPSCQLPMRGLDSTAGPTLCWSCGTYVESAGGALSVMPDDRVAAAPIFALPLPEDRPIQWPPGCAVCGAPATQNTTSTLRWEGEAPLMQDAATRLATLGFFKLVQKNTISVEIPHCAAHRGGACLAFGRDNAERFQIQFVSRAVQREFAARNGLLPVPRSSLLRRG